MNRRNFLKNSLGLTGLFLLPDAVLLSDQEKAALKLIREAEAFAIKHWGVRLKRKFYKKWLKQEAQLTYVYASRKDSILLGRDEPSFRFFGVDTVKAKVKAQELEAVGYDTMIYKTSGTSATLLTHHLLNYPQEAILYIVFHEMAHVHRDVSQTKVPYPAEESLGEFLGNYGSMNFVKQNHPELLPAVLKQKNIQEQLYQLLSSTEREIQGIDASLKAVKYAQVQTKLNDLLKEGNVFQQERYSYPANHAYILRNRYYYLWYEEFKQIHESGLEIADIIKLYDQIPENQAEAKLFLDLKIKEVKTSK